MEKKKRFSILKLLIVIICIAAIIVSLAINILFYGNSVPIIFGRVIYLVDENNPMEGDVTTGAALMAKEATDISIVTGDIVLCYPADSPENITLRSINYAIEAEDGTQRYFTRDSFHEDQTDSITKDNIVAVCTGYPENYQLGQFIKFAMSLNGILILLVASSVILLIFIIAAIAQSHSAKEEAEEIELYDYDENAEKKKKGRKKDAPLFDNPDAEPNPELERKKMSIADNFSQKQVNPDSPYQKEREKERTMQFKAQRENSESPTTAAAPDISSAKTAVSAEHTGIYDLKSGSSLSDNTGILSMAEMEQFSRKDTPDNIITSHPQHVPEPAKASTGSSPDISDILKKTEETRRKKSPSDMSVDDLLKMIENEKKKL